MIFLRYELEKRLRSVYVRLDLKFRDIYTKPYTFSFIKIRKWLWKITVFDQFLVLLFAEKINELALILKGVPATAMAANNGAKGDFLRRLVCCHADCRSLSAFLSILSSSFLN